MISTGVVCREFIGRTIELEFLIERVVRLREKHGASLLLTGSAGIGKTRLVHELVAAARQAGIVSVLSHCSEFGDTPYAPIVALGDALDLTAVSDSLETPDVLGGDARHERTRRYVACSKALAELADQQPFLAIVEDIHWASPASLELFLHLLRSLRESPVVFLFTRRDDVAVIEPAALRFIDRIEREADAVLTLSSLAPSEIKALIVSALRDDSRRISKINVDEISQLSDGRPFHAEELLRSVLERSSEATGGTREVVPRSLKAAVVERLENFDESERIALAHSAVIGSRFTVSLLATLIGKPERDILPILRKARNAQLILEEDDGETFFFRHALTREVVYDEILRAEARDLHARIANEAIAHGGDPVSIAYHAWRSGDPQTTLHWNLVCGEQAARVYAHFDAIRHYLRAFKAAAERQTRSDLAERLAQAHYAIGELVEAIEWFNRAIEDCTDDSERAHRLALDAARARFESGDYEGGIALAQEVTRSLAATDSAVRFEAETRAAALLNAIGRPAEAYDHLQTASRLTATPEPRWAARHRGILAHALHGLGRVEESATAFIEAEAASRRINDLDLLERTLNNFACLKAACGDLLGTVETLREALAAAREMKSEPLIAWVQQNIAYDLTLLGRFDEAIRSLEEAASIDHGVASVSRWIAAINARIGTLTGRMPLPHTMSLERALDDALANRDDLSASVVAGAAILRHGSRGESGDAIAERYLAGTERASEPWIAEAAAFVRVDIAREIRSRIAVAAEPSYAQGMHASLALLDARLAVRDRRRDEANAHSQDAVNRFKTLGWPVQEAYAREVRGGVKEAVETLRRIGADAEVRRLTDVTPAMPRRRGEPTLTAREREIVNQIAAGKTNREVADALVISERTVETHVASVYAKLGVSSRRELLALLNPSPAP